MFGIVYYNFKYYNFRSNILEKFLNEIYFIIIVIITKIVSVSHSGSFLRINGVFIGKNQGFNPFNVRVQSKEMNRYSRKLLIINIATEVQWAEGRAHGGLGPRI